MSFTFLRRPLVRRRYTYRIRYRRSRPLGDGVAARANPRHRSVVFASRSELGRGSPAVGVYFGRTSIGTALGASSTASGDG